MTLRSFMFLAIFSMLFIFSSCYNLRGQSSLTKALLKARECPGGCIFDYPQNTDGDCEDSESNAIQGGGQSGTAESEESPVTSSFQPLEEEEERDGFSFTESTPETETETEPETESAIYGEPRALAQVICEIVKDNCRTIRGRQVCDTREICA